MVIVKELLIKIILILFFFPSLLAAQYQNVRVSKVGSNDPEEVTIAINPANPQNLVAGANLSYYYYSVNGGQTWTEGRLISTFGVWGDPSVIFDAAGNAYFGHLSNPANGYWIDRIVVQKSTFGGAFWTDGAGIGLNPPKNQDKEWLTADLTNSAFRNNIYVAWTEFDRYDSANPLDSTRVLFSRSPDFGSTWSQPVRVSDHGGNALDGDNTVEGAVPAVGPNGEVFISWAGPLGIMFDKSVDGGMTFGRDIFVTDQPGGWDLSVPGIYRCNGLPVTACDISNSPYRGQVYVLWADQRNGIENTDVLIIKSMDGGQTWGPAKIVNNDDKVAHQFFPWISVDPLTGIVWIVFYDRRNTSGNATEVYVAKSTDGGETFENFPVSKTAFTPQENVFFGDYINIAARDGMVYPIWMRMEGMSLSVWAAIIKDTTTTGAVSTAGQPQSFYLAQNYPNPFNPITTITFHLKKPSHARLAIFAATGEEVIELIDADLQAGDHSIEWNGTNAASRLMPSAVYFYRLTTGEQTQVRRMVILR